MRNHFISRLTVGLIEFWQRFYAEFMHYPEWFCRLRDKAYKYFWPIFISYFFMLVMVCFLWPSMYEPSIRSTVYDMYPDWFSYLMKLCWEYIPATKRHTYNASMGMMPYVPGIYTVNMIFFIPVVCFVLFWCDISKFGSDVRQDSFLFNFFSNKFIFFFFVMPCIFSISLYFLFFYGSDLPTFHDSKYVKNNYIFNTRIGVCTVGGIGMYLSFCLIGLQVHVFFKGVLSFFVVLKRNLLKGVINE